MPTIKGERIAIARRKQNLTQEALAKKVYLSKKVISNLETGKTKSVNEYVLNLLSYTLFVTKEYLTGEVEEIDINSKGLKQIIFKTPKWNFEEDLINLFEKHSKSNEIETLLREVVYYLYQQEDESHYNRFDGVRVLQEIIKLLKLQDKKEIKMTVKILLALQESAEKNNNNL